MLDVGARIQFRLLVQIPECQIVRTKQLLSEIKFNEFNQPIDEPVVDWAPPPKPEKTSLEGHFCRIEPLEPMVHAKDLYLANGVDIKGSSWTYLPYGPFESFSSYLAWIKTACSTTDPFFYAIVDNVRKHAIGVASYLRIDPSAGSIEIGHLNFSPLLQRTSAATEAMYLMMSHAFDLGYRRCEWKCDALNIPSRRAAQRLGFSFEGIFRAANVIKGRNRDTAWYAIIESDWAQIRSALSMWLSPSNFDEHGNCRTSLSNATQGILNFDIAETSNNPYSTEKLAGSPGRKEV